MKQKLTVLIVDDHPVFRRGLRGVLSDCEWVQGVIEAGGAEEAVRSAVSEEVDVVAMDLGLPDGSGIDATARICRARPGIAVLILTMTNDAGLAGRILSAGGRGYLLKDSDSDLIAEALHTVGRGALVLGPHLQSAAVTLSGPTRAPSPVDHLSSRERDMLTALAEGRTNAQIGRRLGLSEKTVRNQLSAVYAKLQVSDRTQAALRAREAGLGGR